MSNLPDERGHDPQNRDEVGILPLPDLPDGLSPDEVEFLQIDVVEGRYVES